MPQVEQLTAFYKSILHDNRIGATHISTYMALFQLWHLNHFENPVTIKRDEVMRTAKISSRATYHKCINELVEFGFIRYVPSFNPLLKSKVYIQTM